jgi:hypothetical protein
VIAALNLGTVRQNQDAETRRLSRKTERRSWPKREGVWPKNAVCGQNVKNAGQKKIYNVFMTETSIDLHLLVMRNLSDLKLLS